MPQKRTALLSVYDKTSQFDQYVRVLDGLGFEILSSGGTYKHITENLRLKATDITAISRVKPCLDHRVVTLVPEVHGGLLADPDIHLAELESLGWPFIDLVVCTFYPLAKTMDEKGDDYAAINQMVDIGGPTMVRSACKGGRLVATTIEDFGLIIDLIQSNHPSEWDIRNFQFNATQNVAAYVALEAQFRRKRRDAV